MAMSPSHAQHAPSPALPLHDATPTIESSPCVALTSKTESDVEIEMVEVEAESESCPLDSLDFEKPPPTPMTPFGSDGQVWQSTTIAMSKSHAPSPTLPLHTATTTIESSQCIDLTNDAGSDVEIEMVEVETESESCPYEFESPAPSPPPTPMTPFRSDVQVSPPLAQHGREVDAASPQSAGSDSMGSTLDLDGLPMSRHVIPVASRESAPRPPRPPTRSGNREGSFHLTVMTPLQHMQFSGIITCMSSRAADE